MAGYESEQEQIEEIKKWWKENGTSVVAGVVIGAGLLFGWRWWQTYTVQQAQIASNFYEQVLLGLDKKEIQPAREVAGKLLSDHSGSPYAILAALNIAHQDLEKGDVDSSHARLQWVIDQKSSLTELTHIARLRKARLYLSQKKLAEANNLIAGIEPTKFKAAYAELRGDIAMAENKINVARTAYTEALANKEAGPHSQWVQMKLDDLGWEKRIDAGAPISAPALGNPSTTPAETLSITQPVSKEQIK